MGPERQGASLRPSLIPGRSRVCPAFLILFCPLKQAGQLRLTGVEPPGALALAHQSQNLDLTGAPREGTTCPSDQAGLFIDWSRSTY